MGNKRKNRVKEHLDESEIWKRKTLTSAENRKKFANLMNMIMWLAALLVVLACVYAYFFDK